MSTRFEKMVKIHEEVSRCRRCAGILDESRIIPRSGFPQDGTYAAMVIGCEPGQDAQDRPTPEEYKRRFDWRIPDNNRNNPMRSLFKAFDKAGIEFDTLFFTNSVKCPATPAQAADCYEHCKPFLNEQIKALRPHVIVVLGRAADRFGVDRAAKEDIIDCTLQGRPCVAVTHPQGATRAYLAKVGQHVQNKMSLN